MALNVASWTDKQLDELSDLLRASDYSAVASFIAENFLAIGSRIMTDPTQTTLRVTVNAIDTKVVDISPGIFLHNVLIGELDTAQTVNILDSVAGTWGTGLAPDAANPRWSIICVKQNEQLNTSATRWFVDDSVVPNTYFEASVNTLINKAYYDIVVVHGTAAPAPVVPAATAGYWTIAEIYVPPLPATAILDANIYDTVDPSNRTPKNWVTATEASLTIAPTRVLRLEFWSTLFGVDHDPVTGYHRVGGWHIGATAVTSTADELNRLDGVGATVTPGNLTQLTDGSTTSLHSHATGTRMYTVYHAGSVNCGASWTNLTDMYLAITTTQTLSFMLFYSGSNQTIWSADVRFLVDGVATDGYAGGNFVSGSVSIHHTALNLVSGLHTFYVQAQDGWPLGSKLALNRFSIIVL